MKAATLVRAELAICAQREHTLLRTGARVYVYVCIYRDCVHSARSGVSASGAICAQMLSAQSILCRVNP